MWLTAFWVVLFLMQPNWTLSVGEHAFWALVFALIYDFFWNGYYNRIWVRRP